MKFDRIFFFGDSITLGSNDSTGLGWPGRLTRGLLQQDRNVACYNLGVNGDTSLHIRARWRVEVDARARETPGLLIFAFGFNDAAKPNGGDVQVKLEESLCTARTILTEAITSSEVLWIGPTPLDESVNPMLTPFASWDMKNDIIAGYDEAYAGLALEIGIDYLSLFSTFLASPRYQAALLAGDKVHPADDGYVLIAEQVAGWSKWQGKLA